MSVKKGVLPISDTDNMHEMSKPFEDGESANEAFKAFSNELYKLRNKYKIANVSFIVSDLIKGDGLVMTRCHFGDVMQEETMAAWHLGHTQVERQQMIRKAGDVGASQAIERIENRG